MQMNIKKMYFNNNINCFKQKKKRERKRKKKQITIDTCNKIYKMVNNLTIIICC